MTGPLALGGIDHPQIGSIAIRFPNVFVQGKPLTFSRFLSYELHEHFLLESDGWNFQLAQDAFSYIDLNAIVPRASVQVSIDDVVQSIGILDDVHIHSSREGGTVASLSGRSWLSPATDSNVDPNTRFKPSMTILDVLTAVFAPFGMKAIATDNTANRNAITGRTQGRPTSPKGNLLKKPLGHELKPYVQESAFKFASRVAQRAGLWLRPAADGETVLVGVPDYTQDPLYSIIHRTDDPSNNNVLDGDVLVSGKDQPSVILACGFGGGGEPARTTLRSGITNPTVNADLSSIINAYPSVKFVSVPAEIAALVPFDEPCPRPLYLYDPDSHTQAELNNFTVRELSLLLRKSLSAKYTILGHQLGGANISVDTIVAVEDDRSNIHGPLWVIGRHFKKSPGSGTTTEIELVRPGSLQLSTQPQEGTQ